MKHEQGRVSGQGSAADAVAPTKAAEPLLFATGLGDFSQHALAQALAVAERLGCSLHVLRVLPSPGASKVTGSVLDFLATSHVSEPVRMDTERVCRQVAPRDEVGISVQRGDFMLVVMAVAEELEARIIVLCGGRSHRGDAVTALARDSRRPVLLMEPARGGVVIAATDLSDPAYPVLMQGADLAERMETTLTAVHNAEVFLPFSPPRLGAAPPLGDATLATTILESACRRMRTFARSGPASVEGVVVARFDSAQAILDVAHQARADVIVVGTRRRPWLRRLVRTSVAAEVVDHASTSVMVVPIPSSERRPES